MGTVCCVLEGILELEDAGGIKVLADTLKDVEAKEEEKSEAAGLLAQVTSPWIENNSSIEGLASHLEDLVVSLTSKFICYYYCCFFVLIFFVDIIFFVVFWSLISFADK